MTTAIPAISRAEIAESLSKIRNISVPTQASGLAQAKPMSPFKDIMSVAQQSLKAINATQNGAESMKEAYLKGDPKVSLSTVLLSSIQSKVAFEGLLVVRNKLIEAYKEIMNMPV